MVSTKFVSISVWLILTTLSAGVLAADNAGLAVESSTTTYLKCSSDSDPEGVNDRYIDTKARTFTDSFGIVTPYREEGPLLVADTFVDADSQKTVSTSTRINRFTLDFIWLSPTLKLHRTGKCIRVDRKL